MRSASKGENLEKLFGPGFSYVIVPSIDSVCVIQWFYAILLTDAIKHQPDAFDEVVKEGQFSAIIHTAAVVTLDPPEDPQELIVPAVAGTKNVILAAHKYGYATFISQLA